MSLIKQLWLLIAGLLLLAFGGSLFIGLITSRAYIEQEIRIKNADNATALALTISQMPKDPTTLDVLISAQFDTGHYRRIELRDPTGALLEERLADNSIENVPAWFVDLVALDAPAGEAVIQDGWRQFGTLTVQSRHDFAYRTLWRSALTQGGWLLLAGLVSLLLGGWLVHAIRSPLQAVIAQARDIGMRRFTTSRLPRTRELREVVEAMNRLSGTIGEMLTHESEKLDLMRRRLQHDPVSDALNREAFLTQLQINLESHDFRASGTLAMVRVAALAELNERLGHAAVDRLLAALTQTLRKLVRMQGGGRVGRLNGRDFALLLPGLDHLEPLQHDLERRLASLAQDQEAHQGLPAALVHYRPGDRRSDLLASLDGALSNAETQRSHGRVIIAGEPHQGLLTCHADWRTALQQAIQEGVYLAHFPVLDAHGRLLHFECPSRLRLAREWQPAGVFMPWISRLGLDAELDLAVVDAALQDIAQRGHPVAINLSVASIADAGFVLDLHTRLQTRRTAAPRLWLEFPETMAIRELDSFRSLCRALRPLGCRLGLEHVGPEFTRIADLHDLGLAYLKLDDSLVKGVDTSLEQQAILRGMATLSHSLGILAIAEGVETRDEVQTLFELGLDAVTGPGVRHDDKPS